ncbi:hypothetical protein [Celerinatantimonas sp. YJH-8]|uniref:hypothetical protein n=1 Tax=Celerinatantimonas sp. YJH-8 TaxID=3228714 RepID=UPI0038C358B8
MMVPRLATYLFIDFVTVLALVFHWSYLDWWQGWLVLACSVIGMAIEVLVTPPKQPPLP